MSPHGYLQTTRTKSLCRYGARGPLSLERLTRREDGKLEYRLKKPAPNGAAVLVLELRPQPASPPRLVFRQPDIVGQQCDLLEGEARWFTFPLLRADQIWEDFCPARLSLSQTASHGVGLVPELTFSEETLGNGRTYSTYTPAGQSLWVFP